MSLKETHKKVIQLQCDGNVADNHRDYTVKEIINIYNGLGDEK